MIPVPCRSEPWKSWFLLSSSKKHLNAQKNYIRFWYDNAGFSRLVEVVDMEDLWHLEKNSSKRGNCMAWPTHEDHFQPTCFDMIPVPWRWNTIKKADFSSHHQKKLSECTKKLSGFGTIMVVLADLWKLWTWKTSGTLKKKNLKTGKLHGLADSRIPFSVHLLLTADVKRCV